MIRTTRFLGQISIAGTNGLDERQIDWNNQKRTLSARNHIFKKPKSCSVKVAAEVKTEAPQPNRGSVSAVSTAENSKLFPRRALPLFFLP